jgi:hypothetical protein
MTLQSRCETATAVRAHVDDNGWKESRDDYVDVAPPQIIPFSSNFSGPVSDNR